MRLRGMNIGGWLLMEGYLLQGRNIPESFLKRLFAERLGAAELAAFEATFRDQYIQKDDFRRIAALRANVVRLPLHYRLLEDGPFQYREQGFALLDAAFSWARDNGLAVILDLHAACGAQSAEWHADAVGGEARFWRDPVCRQRTIALWQQIATRYGNDPACAGYDLLNEPAPPAGCRELLAGFYRDTIAAIRRHDPRGRIFVEGANWAQDTDGLESLIGPDVSLSIHCYLPVSYTFHWVRNQSFPGMIDGEHWDRSRLLRHLERYAAFAAQRNARVFVGEFGINWRGSGAGELDWLTAILSVMNDLDFDYTYWTYKAIAGSVFPDGIYQFLGNPPSVRREGPVYGWENYPDLWQSSKNDILTAWQTASYVLNEPLAGTLRGAFAAQPAELY